MSPDKILVILFGAGGIAFTYWFFLMKKDDIVVVSGSIDIIVEGGYSPSTISISKEKTTKINLIRRDPSTCLEEFILPDFKIKKYLPLNKKVEIEITPTESGVFNFHCGMNMFHGKIIVKE
ncbi:cupredoxin domain-containing protein [Candidatus Gottesmanbacteria bacterium]|nr:cupredoxin domain-containing protein [Candidatus Gottesmanbacteria bacterium]